jgi:hypothetical protein
LSQAPQGEVDRMMEELDNLALNFGFSWYNKVRLIHTNQERTTAPWTKI